MSNVIFKKFSLLPDGNHVLGGEASYSLDTDAGSLQWAASVNVSVFFFHKQFTQSGVIKIDPKQLKPSNFQKGQRLNFGPVIIDVLSVSGGIGKAKISVQTPDVQEVGDAYFDMSGEYIQLKSLDATGTVKGFGVRLDLEAI